MIDNLKPYPAYEDSGVPWLGEVPAHWEVLPLCAVATPKSITGQQHRELLSVYLDRGVILFSDVEEKRTNVTSEDLSKYQAVDPGDFVLNNQQSWRGSVGVSNLSGIVSPAYLVLSVTSRLHAEFANLLFRDRVMVAQYLVCSRGVGSIQRNLYWPHLKRVVFPLPSLPEQTAIVRFLDHAARRIRRYIRAKQKLIALLEEQKQAIIHQAVTGQIDVQTGQPYPAYKPSGIEWLGKVPEHWRSSRLKGALSRATQNGLFKKKDQFGFGTPLINVADVYRERYVVEPAALECVRTSADEAQRFQVQEGDIFFVRSSLKLEGTGRSAIVTHCSLDTVFECHLVQARPDSLRINPRYLVIQLNSYALRHYLVSRANVVTMATIAQDTISSCPVLIPPRAEQDRIVQWLDTQWSRIIQANEHANREIDLLREYRTCLIADVVTGKLDVREASTALPEVDPLATEDTLDDTLNTDPESDIDELDTTAEEVEA